MKIIFISNAITPHQIPLCDQLNSLPDVSLVFIESENIDKNSLPIGWRASCDRSYVVSYFELKKNHSLFLEMIMDADAVIYGSGDYSLIEERLLANKLVFLYSERIYRNWREKIKYPYHLIKFNKMYGRSKELYLLCASAFAAKDYNSLGLFKNKTFKWGYFTKAADNDLFSDTKMSHTTINILWCSRFISFKHPELAVMLAHRLKHDGYNFHLNMIGTGKMLEYIETLVNSYDVADVVTLLGSMSNDDVYRQMKFHDIFLFTSDQNEGWGAVTNEAMSNGCVIVGSNKIGSIPYVVKNGENGMIFKSGNIESLYRKVKYLIDNPEKLHQLSENGIKTIANLWSPQNAAYSLRILINDLLDHRQSTIKDGPCSRD